MAKKLIFSHIKTQVLSLFLLFASSASFAQSEMYDSNLEPGNVETLVFIPNAFTPNGDEFNQEFRPTFGSDFDTENYHLMVFNRWGETVFESYDVSTGWDGTYAGVAALEGQYVWTIRYKHLNNDGYEVLNGHISIFK